jgi:hypothetical protein
MLDDITGEGQQENTSIAADILVMLHSKKEAISQGQLGAEINRAKRPTLREGTQVYFSCTVVLQT